jgi:hypothetical protein
MTGDQTRSQPENYNVGSYIAHRIEELGVSDYFVVPGRGSVNIPYNLISPLTPLQETATLHYSTSCWKTRVSVW